MKRKELTQNKKKIWNVIGITILILVITFIGITLHDIPRLEKLVDTNNNLLVLQYQDTVMLKKCKVDLTKTLDDSNIKCYGEKIGDIKSYQNTINAYMGIKGMLEAYRGKDIPADLEILKENYLGLINKTIDNIDDIWDKDYKPLMINKEVLLFDIASVVPSQREQIKALNKEIEKPEMIKKLNLIKDDLKNYR